MTARRLEISHEVVDHCGGRRLFICYWRAIVTRVKTLTDALSMQVLTHGVEDGVEEFARGFHSGEQRGLSRTNSGGGVVDKTGAGSESRSRRGAESDWGSAVAAVNS